MALHVKKGDTVQIIAGDHKGNTGRVLHVYPDKSMVVVQGRTSPKNTFVPRGATPRAAGSASSSPSISATCCR
jgi:large subunit ribosomal protein L24